MKVKVKSLSRVRFFETPWTAACQASLSFTLSQSLLKLNVHWVRDSIQPSHPLSPSPFVLLPSIFPSIRVFSNETALPIRWPKYWNFSFIISPSNEYLGWFPLRLTGLISLLSKGLSSTSQGTSPAPQFKSISSLALSLLYGPTLTSIHDSLMCSSPKAFELRPYLG